MRVIFPNDIYRATSFNFDFTYTLKDQGVDLNTLPGNVILDVNGSFYEKSSFRDSVNITIVGGIDKHVNAKVNTVPYPFYLTIRQKQSLYSLFRLSSSTSVNKQINSPNVTLRDFLESLYLNFRG